MDAFVRAALVFSLVCCALFAASMAIAGGLLIAHLLEEWWLAGVPR